MSARIIYSNYKSDEINTFAMKVTKQIATITKKQNGNVKSVNIDYYSVGHGRSPFGRGADVNSYIDFAVSVGELRVEGLGERDLNTLCRFVADMLSECEAYQFKTEEHSLYCGMHDVDIKCIREVVCLAKPCKEFDALNKFITKRTGKGIDILKWYDVDLFGKRGSYDESGNKTYLCFNAKKCAAILAEIKPKATAKDTMTFAIVEQDYIDDLDYSIRYETECYGRRYNRLEVKVTTPSGREKLNKKF